MTAGADRWIRWTTTGCVALLALIAGTVSYLHMHMLVELHGQPGWVAALTPLSVDGMIVAASTTLLADSRAGGRGGVLPWALLVVGSVASLAANVAVAEPTLIGRVIAAWPSFALTRQVRGSATGNEGDTGRKRASRRSRGTTHMPSAERQCRDAHLCSPDLLRDGPWAGIYSARRGSGLWPTGPVTARFPVANSSPIGMAVTSA